MSTAARWRQLSRLLDEALALEAEARTPYMRRACAGDDTLFAEAVQLLQDCERASGFLEEPAAEFATPLLLALEDGLAPAYDTLIGPWRILAEAGRGGMGTIYLAERADDQYHQRVALKVVRGVFTLDDHLIRRFREERNILAALQHPNISRLLDGGVTADGLPWFAMEYVAGLPINEHVRRDAPPVEERLQLFLSVCDAVQYAHQNLVVHRDLKPSNLLVTPDGNVKLLDFGIARLLPADLGEIVPTVTGFRLLTPTYASPEQISGAPLGVATDIYSLGVILCELLTGRTPYLTTERQPHLVTRAILEDEPMAPSRLVDGPGGKRLRGDLDAIIATATRRIPAERYASVAALADDIRRHLGGLVVAARGQSRAYRALSYVRRHRIGLGTSAVVFLSLTLGLGVALSQARRAGQERAVARQSAARAEQVAGFLANIFRLADPNTALGDTITVAAALDSAAIWMHRDLAASPEARAELAMTLGVIHGAIGNLDKNRVLLDTALAIQERLYSPEDPRLANTLTLLAEAMRGQGQLARSEPLLRRALGLQRQDSSALDRDVDHTLNMLALALRDLKRPAEGEVLLREALVTSRRNASVHPIGLHRTLTNLAHVLLAQGKADEAAALHEEVLRLRREYWGHQHPEVANALINLATAHGREGRFAESEQYFKEGLAMRRLLQGPQHPEVGVDLAGLAAMYLRQGAFGLAESTYADALEQMSATLASDHPLRLAAAESLTVVRARQRERVKR
jgi:eukaryotic-like serine/threonine-protein kinase